MKIVILIAYFAITVILGIVSVRKTKTLSDFYLAGRNVGPWMSAFSYGVTYFSAALFIGYAGQTGWGFGLSNMWVVAGNAIFGCFVAWKVLAKPTHSITVRLGAMTLPQFLQKRYNSRVMKIFAAAVIFIFLVPYSSSVYTGLSYIFEMVFHIDYTMALILIAVVTSFYLVMGGYKAVTLVDLFQGCVMIFGVFILLFYIFRSPEVGGLSNAIANLRAINPELTSPIGPSGKLVAIISTVILTSLGPWGMPQMVQKFYAVKNEKIINAAAWVTLVISAWIAFGGYFTGALSHLFFGSLAEAGGTADRLVPTMISMSLPDAAAALILVLVLAASMSTLAGLVLVSSSAVSIDMVQEARPGISERKTMFLMRILCVIFIIISVLVSIRPGVIQNLMALSWGSIAGAFLAPFIYGIFTRWVTKAGAWSGMITGLVLAVVLPQVLPAQIAGFAVTSQTAGSIAMIVPLFVVPIVSSFTKKFSAEHLAKVFGDNETVAQRESIAEGTLVA